MGSDSYTASSEKGHVYFFLEIYICNLYACLSPLLCNLALCLHGSAGLSDPCVYKLAGYRHSGQIHHPEFSFPYVLGLKYFPVAARVYWIFVGQSFSGTQSSSR